MVPDILRVSPAVYAEIRHEMGIKHAPVFGEVLHLKSPTLIAQKREPKPTPHASARNRKKLRAGKPAL